MPTYYKYQNPSEIGAAPTLDWSTVIKDVNQTLQNQEQQRYDNREFDKKVTNDILTKVNEVVLTSDPNLNALVTNMSYDAKRNIFELKKKLESGQISRSDFNIATQNTSSSVAQLNQFTKTYGADYDKYLKDVQEGKTSAYADFMQKWKGGFQNFKNKKLVHNPTDGRLYVAQLDESGNVVSGDLGLVPMSTLTEIKNFNDPRIDVLAETNRYASQFKPFIDVVRSGKIETREQIENYPGFKDLVNNITEAIAKNDKGYASILTDTDGTYSITGKNFSSGKNIGLKNNGAGEMIPIIDDNMKARAREVVKEYIIAQTGVKETGTEVFAPQAPRVAAEGKEKPLKAPYGQITPVQETIYETKGYKNGKPILGKVKSRTTTGVAQDVGYIKVDAGPGVTDVIRSIGYKNGKLVISGYQVKGKEQEGGTGADKGDTSTEVKKTAFEFDDQKSGPTLSSYIQLITNPRTGEKFTSIEEAKAFYKAEYESRKGSSKSIADQNGLN